MDREGNAWIHKRVDGQDESPSASQERSTATFIDSGADFQGTLRLTESFRIDGEFSGNIESRATVIVGENAGIEANVVARDVIIAGAVVGNITATRQLTLLGSARIHGDIETPSIEVARGAMLNGSTRMLRPELAARAATQSAATLESSATTRNPPSATS